MSPRATRSKTGGAIRAAMTAVTARLRTVENFLSFR